MYSMIVLIIIRLCVFFFFKQKTAYEMRISDWSSDVCSSDLIASDEAARERRVLGLAKLKDPGGNPTEIFFGPQVDNYRPFHPGRPMFGRFVTGAEGIGHCILRQDDVAAAVDRKSTRLNSSH